ncbi:MAG: tRNA (adenosine(37)-N6)-dimethylallyltransferase MiaA [Candidatus Kapabacteria bacterium]|nr:tRNA (adenosine(37)-N6)-dimethylallyltransferase MiaA [Candidatus Kapabacteria bacterium]
MMRRVLVIGGPTAAGKTATSLELGKLIPCEIICADARQLYRRLDIGTAKPTADERARIPHRLFDILEPHETINAAEYAQRARSAIKETSITTLPMLVGGSGLYISATLDGLSPVITDVDESIREKLQLELHQRGRDELYDELRRVDPTAAELYSDKNPRRITRALEVFRATGKPISEFWKLPPEAPPYEAIYIGITCERDELKRRIDDRCEAMWNDGFLEEVAQLLASGVKPSAQSMQSVGYRQAAEVVLGERSLDDAMERLKVMTWQYAKRQLTWFTRDLRYAWLASDPQSNARTIWSMLRERNWIDD